MSRRILVIGGVAVLAIVAILIWLLGSSSRSGTAGGGGASEEGTGAATANRPDRGRPGQLPGVADPGGAEQGSFAGGAGGFPPDSMPLRGRGRHAVNSNAGAERVSTIKSSSPSTGSDPAGAGIDEEVSHERRQLNYVLRADKYGIAGHDVLNMTLEVYRGDQAVAQARVPARVTAAYITTKPQPGNAGRKVATLQFRDDGKDGDIEAHDLVYSSRFVPAQSPIAPTAGVFFPAVEFTTEGGEPTLARISFAYTPESVIPGRFTGVISDAQVDGSLVITAGVDIDRPGDFVIDGTLFDSDGEPIGRATFHGSLQSGATDVKLRFYGLMFRQRDKDGPYVLRHMRGHRSLPGEVPDREVMPMYVGNYQTADYAARSFTGDPAGGDFDPSGG